MALSDKNRSGHVLIHRVKKSNRSGLEFKGSRIYRQQKILATIRIARLDAPQLSVERVGIRKRQALFADGYADLLFGDGQFQCQIGGPVKVNGGYQVLETLLGYLH